jgi:carnosine N-methyltransferase
LAPGGVWINLGTLSLVDIEKVSHFVCGGLGPLLWHWENNTTNDPSVELDLEELKNLARNIGFELSVSTFSLSPFRISVPFRNPMEHDNASHHYHYLHHLTNRCQNERTVDATYTNNGESMLGYVYHAAFWTATKVA